MSLDISEAPEFRFLRERKKTKTRGVYSNNKYSVTLYSWYPNNVLGEGSFGQVVSSYDEAGRRKVAIKIFKGDDNLLEAKHEAMMIHKCKHKNIIKILDTFKCSQGACIVFYKYPYSLDDYFESKSCKLSDDTLKSLTKQLALAVEHLQNLHLIHRDIKLENILLDDSNQLKLCDFGCCTTVSDGKHDYSDVGTPWYQAPECGQAKGYTIFADNWSVGVCVANLSFENKFDTQDTKCLEWIDNKCVDKQLQKVLRGLLKKDPLQRLTIGELLQSEWLTGQIDVDYIPSIDLTD